MAGFDINRFIQSLRGQTAPSGGSPPPRHGGPQPPPLRPGRSYWKQLAIVVAGLAVIYAGYFWLVRRYVVADSEVLVLLRKDAGRSLPGDQIVIPAKAGYPDGDEAWEAAYGDVNGILESVYLTGTYFGFSPFDFERETYPIVEVPPGKVGVVVRKFGAPLAAGQ